jgi:hypothetical protein
LKLRDEPINRRSNWFANRYYLKDKFNIVFNIDVVKPLDIESFHLQPYNNEYGFDIVKKLIVGSCTNLIFCYPTYKILEFSETTYTHVPKYCKYARPLKPY